MSVKVTQEQFKEIEDGSYILSDGEMSAEFRQFLSDSRIEVRVWKHPRTNFDYVFCTRDLQVVNLSINLKESGNSAIQIVKQLFDL